MKFTDLFIYRPVLATVISLLIFVVGLASFDSLTIRQYPEISSSTVTISTSYPGANQSLVQGFVTQPIQSAIAGVEGVDFITSTSKQGASTVEVHLKLGYDVNAALNDINANIQSAKYLLPKEVLDPVVQKDSSSTDAIMYLSYTSKNLSAEQITDYLNRIVVPSLQTLGGVAQAKVMGAGNFAMRIWLNPIKMTAYHITASDIVNALNQNNVLATPGSLKGKYDEINIVANTDLQTPEQFNNMVLKTVDGKVVRVRDIGHAQLGPETTDFNVKANNQSAVVIAISSLSTANPLTVADEVRHTLPVLKKQYPPGLKQLLLYDASTFISDSIHSVVDTIFEAIIIVLIVIFLFLGNFRAVTIPIITIPLCLVGVMSFMLALGFSINILTLLAMVLSIGLVVDDAIVVVENVSRHIENGEKPFAAAIHGAREIAMPVVTMSTTLAAVFIPIGFLGGLTGRLFTEFAFVLAGTVILSGVIALTLSPMMCSKMLVARKKESRLSHYIDSVFSKVMNGYKKMLQGTMNAKPVALLFTLVILIACFMLFSACRQELAPQEDQGFLLIMSNAPTNANIDYTSKYLNKVSETLNAIPQRKTSMAIAGMMGQNTGFSFMLTTPYSERDKTIFTIKNEVDKLLFNVTGLQNFSILPPTLPGTSFGMPIQFVLKTIDPYDVLDNSMQELIKRAQKSGLFLFMNSDLKYQKPELNINVNRDLASNMGISAQEIANSIGSLYNNSYVTLFNLFGRGYKVIPQAYRKFRWNPSTLNDIYLNTMSGKQVPLSSFISTNYEVVPDGLNQFQQMNSATFQATPAPGVSMGQALNFLQQTAAQILPPSVATDYNGQLRQFVDQPSVAFLFAFALIFIFLILSAQFESFREPIIILISVPLCLFSALFLLNFGLGTINIFTKIGMVTLIGLIAKQGILIVEFANKIQETEGYDVEKAVIEAAAIRLRPILMTTGALFFGVLPLLFTNAGLIQSQRQLAIVILSGMSFGTFFTIFVVPVFYYYLASSRQKINEIQ